MSYYLLRRARIKAPTVPPVPPVVDPFVFNIIGTDIDTLTLEAEFSDNPALVGCHVVEKVATGELRTGVSIDGDVV